MNLNDRPYEYLLERVRELETENAALREWKRDASDLCGKGPDIIVARELLADIIVEEMPHGLRSVILASVLSCSMFFFLGFFGRDVWNYHVNNVANGQAQCAPDQTVGAPRRTLQWRLPDEPKK